MALNYVTLTVDVFDGQGNYPTSGTATFTPSAALTDTTNHEYVAQIPVVASFKASGLPAARLLATDNGTVAPSGWGWAVTFAGFTGAPAGWSFFLPFSGGASQNLADIAPTSSTVSMAAYLPIDYPTGAASGYVWTSDSSGNGAWKPSDQPLAHKTSSYPMVVADSGVLADASSAALTITLPDATQCADGRPRTVKDWKGQAAAHNITVATTASQKIDGASAVVINASYASFTFISDGANWSII